MLLITPVIDTVIVSTARATLQDQRDSRPGK
jgi:hypothetical protein